MNTLTTQILNLSREQLLEAALALQDQLALDEGAPVTEAMAPLRGAPLEHIAEIEDLVRVFLLTATMDPQIAPVIERVVASVGRKAFIFGGMEVVAAAAIAIAGLQLVFSKGKTAETMRVEFTREGDKETVTINHDVKYGLSGATSTLIQTVLGAFGKH